jgi:hypothetical protein
MSAVAWIGLGAMGARMARRLVEQRDIGHSLLVQIMDSDLAAGVRQRPRQVTAGRRLTLLECDLVSPPWDPEHCPPGVLWLLHLDDDRIRRVRLFHPAAATG